MFVIRCVKIFDVAIVAFVANLGTWTSGTIVVIVAYYLEFVEWVRFECFL